MVKSNEDLARFARLDYDRFRDLARDEELSPHERIGFPDSYREGMEGRILADVRSKLTRLDSPGALVLDIGPGCGRLAGAIIDHCRSRAERLVLIDSPEMLNRLPEDPFLDKVPGRFPDECGPFLAHHRGRIDAVLVYSVLHYVFVQQSVFEFLDRSLELLAPGGQMLLGDLPNCSMRNRFFSSEAGRSFHREFMQTTDAPVVEHGVPTPGQIDDSVVLALISRARTAGFDAYLLPQAPDLPMANRREDVLIRRP